MPLHEIIPACVQMALPLSVWSVLESVACQARVLSPVQFRVVYPDGEAVGIFAKLSVPWAISRLLNKNEQITSNKYFFIIKNWATKITLMQDVQSLKQFGNGC